MTHMAHFWGQMHYNPAYLRICPTYYDSWVPSDLFNQPPCAVLYKCCDFINTYQPPDYVKNLPNNLNVKERKRQILRFAQHIAANIIEALNTPHPRECQPVIVPRPDDVVFADKVICEVVCSAHGTARPVITGIVFPYQNGLRIR